MSDPRVHTTGAPKLLIVDDDIGILSQLSLALSREYDVSTAENADTAWEQILAESPDLITLDLALDGVNPETGFSLLEKCLQHDPYLKIILITGNDEEANALRAVEQGAADFFSKPVDITELRILLRRVLKMGRLERQNADLLKQLSEEHRLGSLVGQSPGMLAVYKKIRKVASVDIPVLVLGESGTGKELVAREIRRLGSRATKPLVIINCGAIPENLLESELFGHEKGAFTGAHASRPGRLEMAEGGIVFLDEIGELPVSLQVKLLRFLQEYEIERVGGRNVIKLDVRVIAATSRDLEEMIADGLFRQDLYYRLSVVNVKLPPLRERPNDILFLGQYFLDRFAEEHNRGPLSITPKAKVALQHYSWPGNVRELEHRMQKGVLMSSGKLLDVDDLELDDVEGPKQVSLKEARQETDRQTIQEALRLTCGNITMAAKALGISRPSLHTLLEKLEIKAQDYKSPLDQERNDCG